MESVVYRNAALAETVSILPNTRHLHYNLRPIGVYIVETKINAIGISA